MTNVTCPVCMKTNSAQAWDKATAAKYDEYAPIHDPMMGGCLYVCPSCRKRSYGYMLTIRDALVTA